ncbi:MAG TPA: 4'-phosphopantetheinyl transferase superfamily protein [Solirubrobacterales bacterium]|nr:4'-phosphopantetheinyl transferase superfamily protein [Solirubrobacterales bacterium]
MIEQILPAAAVAVEAFGDDDAAALFPAEQEAVGRAVEKRRREFTTARGCAREALGRLGFEAGPIPSGARGEPLWPAGAVGSISHCDGYRAAAVARAGELASIGIDAEPNQPLPQGLLGDVALPAEAERLRELARQAPTVNWDRLLFSAKEAVYKAWFPLAQRWLGFEDAQLEIDPDAGSFSARLLVPGPTLAAAELRGFEGRWLLGRGLVLTAVAVRT